MTGTLFDAPVTGISRGEMVRRAVKSAIIGGYLAPGDKVTATSLVQQSGSTAATVAPAVNTLIEEGFLTRTGRDAAVAVVTEQQGLHAADTLRLIATAITPTDSESGRVLLDYVAALTGTARTEYTGMFRAAREAFARAATECANPTLAHTLTRGIDGLLWRTAHAPTLGQLEGDDANTDGSPW